MCEIRGLWWPRSSTTGGESVFSDSFRAAELMRINRPNVYSILKKYPVTFHYRNDGKHYHYTRPTIVEDLGHHSPRISHTNYAPPFQAPFEAAEAGIERSGIFRGFVGALKEFAAEVDAPSNQFETRLEPGTCAVFFNRRVLHSRREFDAKSGDRWLKGAYVDIDAFNSKYRTLSEQFRGTKDEEDQDAYEYLR